MSSSGEREWFDTPLGRALAKHEQQWYDQTVSDIFGYNAVQIGCPCMDLLRTSRIPHRVLTDDVEGGSLRVDFHALPFSGQSLDLVVLPHVLEFSSNPHQVLREAERVLIPEGQLLISGFNPFSLWGAWLMAFRHRGDYPWRGRFLGLPRVKDWLSLLGFEIIGGRMCCYVPPFQQQEWRDRLRFMEAAGDRWWALAGGVYFIQARKRVHGVRLIMPGWRETLPVAKSLAAVPQKTSNKEAYREQ